MGKRIYPVSLSRCRQDHPRTCGEKEVSQRIATRIQGSPPHMRGKDEDVIDTRHYYRITPAHAGKSLRTCLMLAFVANHPRTCGEKTAIYFSYCFTVRITPAHARKSMVEQSTRLKKSESPPHMRGKAPRRGARGGFEDHPRTCGEKKMQRQLAELKRGSPPHMRGQVRLCHYVC